jgi:hypothetical protein
VYLSDLVTSGLGSDSLFLESMVKMVQWDFSLITLSLSLSLYVYSSSSLTATAAILTTCVGLALYRLWAGMISVVSRALMTSDTE